MIPLGIVGHSLSIYIFTRPSLRTNPCTIYFLGATIFGIITSCFTLPMRLIQSGYIDMDPAVRSLVACKIIWFFLQSIRSLAFWLIALACADRYLCSSTSTNTRAWSNRRIAVRAIILTILIDFLVYSPIPFFYNIYIIPATRKLACYGQEPYRTVLSYFNLIGFGLAPPLCMIVFNILTIRHINQSKRLRIMPATNLQNTNNQNARKTDRQMLRMLLVQVLVYIVTGLNFSIAQIIIVSNANQPKNVVQVAQENLINAFVGMLTNTDAKLIGDSAKEKTADFMVLASIESCCNPSNQT
ncbi:hypothetical protein I4U23_016588 [Adineta vaga]|nr:hypothetical protein I4U23_016588 [Adineta vaga]